jgi:hypothetical protein
MGCKFSSQATYRNDGEELVNETPLSRKSTLSASGAVVFIEVEEQMDLQLLMEVMFTATS